MKKPEKKLACSVMAVLLGGVVGMGAVMPKAEAVNVIEELMAQVKDNSGAIAQNSQAIQANQAAIQANSKQIAGNEAAIAQNSQAIQANQAAIQANSKQIAGNEAAIAQNSQAIQVNQAAIEANSQKIAANKKELEDKITANETAISTNTGKISANESAIILLNGNENAVGSVKNTVATVLANKVGTLTGEYNYISKTNKVSDNLIALDNAIKANSGTGTGKNSTLLGKESVASAENSTAIGYKNTVSGKNSTAVGTGNVVTGVASGAFGDPSYVYGDGSYSVGNNNTIGLDGNSTLGKDTFVFGSNVTTTANNSVILGTNSTATEDNVVSVGSETNKRKIVNVAAGTSTYDAVNYGQYTELSNDMNRRFSRVNEDIGRTGAASAALASLHPQMMRKGESQVMAGMGRYHGKSGAAVGLAWQPHKRVMLSGGFADAAGEIMFNLGASYKFGQHSYTAEQLAELNNGTGMPLYVAELNAALKSKDVKINTIMADLRTKNNEIDDLKKEVAELKAMMSQLLKTKK